MAMQRIHTGSCHGGRDWKEEEQLVMYAVIETGGKQYRVQNGDQICVEKLNVENGAAVVFDKVLVCGEGADIKVGTPYLEGITVEGEAVESGKGKKGKKQGHRQPYTLVEITAIAGEKAPAKEEAPAEEAEEAKAEAPAEEAPAAEEVKEEAPAEEAAAEDAE